MHGSISNDLADVFLFTWTNASIHKQTRSLCLPVKWRWEKRCCMKCVSEKSRSWSLSTLIQTTVLICNRPLRSAQKDSTSPAENYKNFMDELVKEYQSTVVTKIDANNTTSCYSVTLSKKWLSQFDLKNSWLFRTCCKYFETLLLWLVMRNSGKTDTHFPPGCQRNCWGQWGAPRRWSYPMRRGFPGCVE